MVFARKLNIPPNVLDTLSFYRVEGIIKAYEKSIEEENKRTKNQEKNYDKQYKNQQQKFKPPKMSSMTDYGGFKVPKMNIPKI